MPEYIGKTWNELGWGFIGESNGWFQLKW
jgi:hypothetical protein